MAETSQKISLLIISKFLYNPQDRRWCYLGWDRNSGTVCRPIPSFKPIANEGDFFWPAKYTFEVGETHEFQIVPGRILLKPKTLPHCNNDVFVIHKRRVDKVSVVGMNYLFENLGNRACNTIEKALDYNDGNIPTSSNGKPYVKEGEECQSFGIYKCTSGEALKLSFHDPNHRLPVNQAQDVLVVIETARPLSGFMEFNPRRCFLVEAGVLFIQPE